MKKLLFLFLVITAFRGMALDKEEAAEFLFGTLSLPDKTDYSTQFYLDNIDVSFKAREEMPWGATVPDREFLHFVLPVRVNNETLDNSRAVFYEELKDRVKGLGMEEAILEVNHWCHEKVTYQPSDMRTSSPLSTMSQAIGRCGEESTFTVAALRSVGIPARQIYTPRWAHTDDNHAWVEAWANGKWYFLGACEPEPVLNLGWFNSPASRGLLMTTNVAGDYKGEEEILSKEPLTTRINVTENYAPVDLIKVKVYNQDGSPAENASVNFCIYNYGEFYPVVIKKTDQNGNASLKAGKGDMLVWATDGRNFGYAKGHPGNLESLKIVLDKDKNYEGEFELDIIPPKSSGLSVNVSEEQKAFNERRKSYEDSLRNVYISTFMSREEAMELAKGLNLDEEKLSKILVESRGNHKSLESLLKEATPGQRVQIVRLLSSVSEKDRRDIQVEAIMDHINNTFPLEETGLSADNDSIYASYILNPRIENEFIRPWRSLIRTGIGEDTLKKFRNDPGSIEKWIKENITVISDRNPQGLKMSPKAVWENRITDNLGRKIFYVALARTAGLPSRIDAVTGKAQYLSDNEVWLDASFDDAQETNDISKGFLTLEFEPDGFLQDPKYYSQFTISRVIDGVPRLLEFDEGSSLNDLFSTPQEFDAGQYLITSGQRLADGSVLTDSRFFHISAGDTLNLPLKIREDKSKLAVIGSVNAENLFKDGGGNIQSLLSKAGRGYYILGFLKPNHEPSEHVLNDISAVKNGFESDGRKIIVLFENDDDFSRFDPSRFPSMPENVVYGIDNAAQSISEIKNSLHLENIDMPLIVIADSFNRIVWVSEGYSIGVGEKILSALSQLEK